MLTKKIAQDATTFMMLCQFQKKGKFPLDVAASTMLIELQKHFQ